MDPNPLGSLLPADFDAATCKLNCAVSMARTTPSMFWPTTRHNVGLKELVGEKGEDYFRTNMKFALLEFWSIRTDDAHVLERESYWKAALHARSLGHNKN